MDGFETRAADWISFEEALARLDGVLSPLPPQDMPLEAAAGLAIAREVRSTLTLPPGPTSHMDGYAVRAADLGAGGHASLRVVGTSRPGAPGEQVVARGEAMRIMTGALLPEGADTVVPVEDTEREDPDREYSDRKGARHEGSGHRATDDGDQPIGTWVAIHPRPGRTIAHGSHVRGPGEEMWSGDVLAQSGDALGPGRLALLAATGMPTLPIHPAPRVALLVTGDELVAPGSPHALQGGVLRVDILSPTLPLLLRTAGARVLPPRQVGDDREALRSALFEAAHEADLVVTTGGASMGEADLVKGALDDLGWVPEFWRIRMRPGSPVSFGRIPRGPGGAGGFAPVLSLPGNPVSAMVTTLVLALPAIRTLGGHRQRLLRSLSAVAMEPLRGPEHFTRFFRVRLESLGSGSWGARLAGQQGSGALRSVAVADGLAIIPEGRASIEDGAPVEVLLLPDAGWAEHSKGGLPRQEDWP